MSTTSSASTAVTPGSSASTTPSSCSATALSRGTCAASTMSSADSSAGNSQSSASTMPPPAQTFGNVFFKESTAAKLIAILAEAAMNEAIASQLVEKYQSRLIFEMYNAAMQEIKINTERTRADMEKSSSVINGAFAQIAMAAVTVGLTGIMMASSFTGPKEPDAEVVKKPSETSPTTPTKKSTEATGENTTETLELSPATRKPSSIRREETEEADAGDSPDTPGSAKDTILEISSSPPQEPSSPSQIITNNDFSEPPGSAPTKPLSDPSQPGSLPRGDDGLVPSEEGSSPPIAPEPNTDAAIAGTPPERAPPAEVNNEALADDGEVPATTTPTIPLQPSDEAIADIPPEQASPAEVKTQALGTDGEVPSTTTPTIPLQPSDEAIADIPPEQPPPAEVDAEALGDQGLSRSTITPRALEEPSSASSLPRSEGSSQSSPQPVREDSPATNPDTPIAPETKPGPQTGEINTVDDAIEPVASPAPERADPRDEPLTSAASSATLSEPAPPAQMGPYTAPESSQRVENPSGAGGSTNPPQPPQDRISIGPGTQDVLSNPATSRPAPVDSAREDATNPSAASRDVTSPAVEIAALPADPRPQPVRIPDPDPQQQSAAQLSISHVMGSGKEPDPHIPRTIAQENPTPLNGLRPGVDEPVPSTKKSSTPETLPPSSTVSEKTTSHLDKAGPSSETAETKESEASRELKRHSWKNELSEYLLQNGGLGTHLVEMGKSINQIIVSQGQISYANAMANQNWQQANQKLGVDQQEAMIQSYQSMVKMEISVFREAWKELGDNLESTFDAIKEISNQNKDLAALALRNG